MYEFKKHNISRKNTCEQQKSSSLRNKFTPLGYDEQKKSNNFLQIILFVLQKKTATKKELQKNKRVPEETKPQ